MPAENVVFVLRLLLAVAGLVVPGWLLARMLRITAWGAALPFSCLLIYLAVLGLQGIGQPLTPMRVWLVLLAAVAGCGAVYLTEGKMGRGAVRPNSLPPGNRPFWIRVAANVFSCSVVRGGMAGWHFNRVGSHGLSLRVVLLVGLGAVLTLAALVCRTCMHPLAGYDTPWRWDHLARMMLRHQSLDFYPPQTADHFFIYPYADGIPPLVASCYWFIYATCGVVSATLTTPFVVGQLVSCLGLVYATARQLGGAGAGGVAVFAVCLTPLCWQGVLIGQETGFTSIAVAGQLAAVVAAQTGFSTRRLLAAGLFAAVGTAAREYGIALSLVAVAATLTAPATRRWGVAVVAAPALAVAAAWFGRNWWLAGNPLFAMPFFGWPPANPVHAAIMAHYSQICGFTAAPGHQARAIGQELLAGAAPLLVVGLAATWMLRRQCSLLLVASGLVTALWAWSIQYTAGGVSYSMRVLTPVWCCLAVAAGVVLFPRSQRKTSPREPLVPSHRGRLSESRRLWVLPLLCGVSLSWWCWNFARAVSFPWPVLRLPTAYREISLTPVERAYSADFFEALDKPHLPPLGVLTDDPYLAAGLIQRRSRLYPVMIWSPDVASLFGPEVSPTAGTDCLIRLKTPLAVLLRGDANWEFLMQQRFFRQQTADWQPVLGSPRGTVELIPAVQRALIGCGERALNE